MDKVLVNVQVPATQEKYDIFIPKTLSIEEAIQLLVTSIEELSSGKYVKSDKEILFYYEQDCIMKRAKKVSDYDLKNGDTLLVF